jgi:uncharacterized protein (TIRG00374 family)
MPLAGVAGVLLLAVLIARLGPTRIAAELMHLGPVLPLVLALTGAKFVLQAAGWRLLLPAEARPGWGASIMATMTGDALGYLTWAGQFTGEPMKAMLMRGSVPVGTGLAAGAAERALYNLTASLLVAAVLLALLARAHPAASAAAAVFGVAGLLLLVRWLRRPSSPAAEAPADPTGHRQVDSGRGVRRRLSAARAVFRQLWRERRSAIPAVGGLCLLQHGLLVVEAMLMLRAMGSEASVGAALVFEAATKIVNTAGAVVPGRLGVAEGGSALLADALGLAASHGLSLALMRRARAVIWAMVGLSLLPMQESRARRAPTRP